MQDRYVGDIGDFAKFALLRTIVREAKLRLAIIWYLYSDERHNADGRHVSYLRDSTLAPIDPDLIAALDRIVSSGRRSVRSIAKSGILPANTTYFVRPISQLEGGRTPRSEKERVRAIWLQKALASAQQCDIVYLDPDNGLETRSVPRHSLKSGKYVFWNEIETFWNAGHSLVVYHHLNRTATVARQTEILRSKFDERFPKAPMIMHFLARRGSCRHFWILGQEKHAEALARCELSGGCPSGPNRGR